MMSGPLAVSRRPRLPSGTSTTVFRALIKAKKQCHNNKSAFFQTSVSSSLTYRLLLVWKLRGSSQSFDNCQYFFNAYVIGLVNWPGCSDWTFSIGIKSILSGIQRSLLLLGFWTIHFIYSQYVCSNICVLNWISFFNNGTHKIHLHKLPLVENLQNAKNEWVIGGQWIS